MNYLLDLSNYRCPIPLLMAKRAIEKLHRNEQLDIILNSESLLQDFFLLCHTHQCQIHINENTSNNLMSLTIKKN
ncbi:MULTISPECIES: sulfurtransferase TusA family protein [Glaesserella]|uniref:Sulfurtransferase TusA family protein n=1 Tax=Glaesserella australis TaxID=2094024 RepID=A0A328C3Z6_9PAST|nr:MULTISPECIES: sulfurtransferase TusA family protein [Glaesserella]AUI65563.1 hypothetical protein CJD39_02740 [Glaesserella sp. 15-184]RAL19760.1 sulfurtransferase TusA family protein [Glaesserella australis]